MTRASIVVGAAVLLLARNAAAEGGPLTLSAAQAEAREHAPETGELLARLRGAQAIADDAGRAQRRDPFVSVTGYPNGLDVGLSWTIDVSGSWRARERSAVADRDRVQSERDNGLRGLDEAVAVAVARVAVSQRAAARLVRIVTLLGLAADAAKRKLDVGDGNLIDADAAALDLAGAQAAAAAAEGDIDAARVQLARLLGRARGDDHAVDDPAEAAAPPSDAIVGALSESDPRVRAALADVNAAGQELTTYERMIWPAPTVGVGYGFRRRTIPTGSFSGTPALSAVWNDADVNLTLTVPLPLFDRQTQPRARALSRQWVAAARLEAVRADVASEVQLYAKSIRAAARTLAALADTPAIVERDFGLLERAVRAGALDAVARAQNLRRLEEAGRRYDTAVFDLRVAQARWARRTAVRR